MIISRDECPFLQATNEIALLITLLTQLAIHILRLYVLRMFIYTGSRHDEQWRSTDTVKTGIVIYRHGAPQKQNVHIFPAVYIGYMVHNVYVRLRGGHCL